MFMRKPVEDLLVRRRLTCSISGHVCIQGYKNLHLLMLQRS